MYTYYCIKTVLEDGTVGYYRYGGEFYKMSVEYLSDEGRMPSKAL